MIQAHNRINEPTDFRRGGPITKIMGSHIKDGQFVLDNPPSLQKIREIPKSESVETDEVGGLLSAEQNSTENFDVIADSEDLLSADFLFSVDGVQGEATSPGGITHCAKLCAIEISPRTLKSCDLNFLSDRKAPFGRFVKGVKSREPAKVSGEPAAVLMKKKDLRGDSEYSKGVENVFYIVNTKKGLFLTKTLS